MSSSIDELDACRRTFLSAHLHFVCSAVAHTALAVVSRCNDLQWDYADKERERKRKLAAEGPKREEGYLSFSRRHSLDDMSIDLSQQLAAKRKPLVERNPAHEIQQFRDTDHEPRFHSRPSAHESQKWERSRRYLQRGAAAMGSDAAAQPPVTKDEARAAEERRYQQLRAEYGLWTAGTAAAGFAFVYASYTKVRSSPWRRQSVRAVTMMCTMYAMCSVCGALLEAGSVVHVGRCHVHVHMHAQLACCSVTVSCRLFGMAVWAVHASSDGMHCIHLQAGPVPCRMLQQAT